MGFWGPLLIGGGRVHLEVWRKITQRMGRSTAMKPAIGSQTFGRVVQSGPTNAQIIVFAIYPHAK